ncbi:MAG TPA: hypothetical protein VFN61_10540 [Acidimicrobiales bacterium]|nr:hypothetical protein [Acidimicrobiales bacterium]
MPRKDVVDAALLQVHLDTMFDQALVYHGYTDYMRDYELFVYRTADPCTGIPPEHLRYLCRLCVHAEINTAVPADIWAKSLDERLIDCGPGSDVEGYAWGAKWQVLYPGAQVVAHSERAEAWSERLGIEFHEVCIETNGHNLTLVFSDLDITRVEPGYRPFTVPDGGPDFKFPLRAPEGS